MSESADKPDRPKSDPKALTPEYHKARKQLMLWVAVLFIWELVGIDLERAKEAGGNAGAIITAIKSPQAVPWALVILIMYFAFKLRIEWGQCNQARREVRESRLDYYSAFIVAGAAFLLYLGQSISHLQFANAVQGSNRLESCFFGWIPGFAVAALLRSAWKSPDRHKRVYRWIWLILGLPVLGIMLYAIFPVGGLNLRWTIPTLLLGLVAGYGYHWVVYDRIFGRRSSFQAGRDTP